jgi:hypothetical protein
MVLAFFVFLRNAAVVTVRREYYYYVQCSSHAALGITGIFIALVSLSAYFSMLIITLDY